MGKTFFETFECHIFEIFLAFVQNISSLFYWKVLYENDFHRESKLTLESRRNWQQRHLLYYHTPPKKVGKTSRFSRTILTLKSSQYNTVNAFAVQKLWKLLTKEFFATSIIKIKEQADSSAMVISKGYFCSVLCTLRNWMMHFLLTL